MTTDQSQYNQSVFKYLVNKLDLYSINPYEMDINGDKANDTSELGFRKWNRVFRGLKIINMEFKLSIGYLPSPNYSFKTAILIKNKNS
ncbi:hypothetical protein [Priestia megaterium]|uniref:hypothetical protein n=1 Tax=Priestia megaterium TaxID=1404 RepID=UPI001C24FE49|nr:hypothetical protein [Priestia megaterium]MBU8689492.1 hypothetical protein [Priestia megaterium]